MLWCDVFDDFIKFLRMLTHAPLVSVSQLFSKAVSSACSEDATMINRSIMNWNFGMIFFENFFIEII